MDCVPGMDAPTGAIRHPVPLGACLPLSKSALPAQNRWTNQPRQGLGNKLQPSLPLVCIKIRNKPSPFCKRTSLSQKAATRTTCAV